MHRKALTAVVLGHLCLIPAVIPLLTTTKGIGTTPLMITGRVQGIPADNSPHQIAVALEEISSLQSTETFLNADSAFELVLPIRTTTTSSVFYRETVADAAQIRIILKDRQTGDVGIFELPSLIHRRKLQQRDFSEKLHVIPAWPGTDGQVASTLTERNAEEQREPFLQGAPPRTTPQPRASILIH